jgi:hypothetical protein
LAIAVHENSTFPMGTIRETNMGAAWVLTLISVPLQVCGKRLKREFDY